MKRFLLATVIVATGCGGAPTLPPVVRDSSGVTIIENFGPSWGRDQGWTVSTEPTLSIGDATRGESYTFERVIGAVRLADGTIVVANSGTQELRWYDAGGTHTSTVGGAGTSGITFTNLVTLGRFGDGSVLAYDGMNLRSTVFGADGSLEHNSSLVMTFQAPPGEVTGVFADSSLLVVRGRRHWVRAMQGQPNAPQGLRRGPTLAFRYSYEDGSFLNGLGTYNGSEQIFRTGRTQIVHVTPRPFGRNAVLVTKGNHLLVGTQDSYEIRVISNIDALETIVRLDRENAPVTQEHLDTYKNARLANVHARERAAREAQLDSLPFPELLPAYSAFLVDTEGNLWVADYRPFGLGPQTWNVFDPSYHMLGSVEVPPQLMVFDIGPDYVLGRWREASGTESIRIYGLEKPPGE
jgi:hypothetical protein